MKFYAYDNKIIINCIYCLSKLRVPGDKGRLSVECPVCKKRFFYNPRSIIDELKQVVPYVRSRLPKSRKTRLLLLAIAALLLIAVILLISGRSENKSSPERQLGPLVNRTEQMFCEYVAGTAGRVTFEAGFTL